MTRTFSTTQSVALQPSGCRTCVDTEQAEAWTPSPRPSGAIVCRHGCTESGRQAGERNPWSHSYRAASPRRGDRSVIAHPAAILTAMALFLNGALRTTIAQDAAPGTRSAAFADPGAAAATEVTVNEDRDKQDSTGLPKDSETRVVSLSRMDPSEAVTVLPAVFGDRVSFVLAPGHRAVVVRSSCARLPTSLTRW